MSKIIASTYEIIEKIGSGGAGDVYLGKHLRLSKSIVLKADKRLLNETVPGIARTTLRREVDTLRNLHHQYIPQVYDYLEEDGVVYTVMEYVEGSSLDELLKQGIVFEQSRIVKWTRQLLDALCYLHRIPPYGILHGDIKPSNIMITPNDDIRLIDFNISLTLGESGVSRIGYTRGYAAPEVYGNQQFFHDSHDFGLTMPVIPLDPEELNFRANLHGRVRSSINGHRFIPIRDDGLSNESKGTLADVRSDIYSVGATLYHLTTGNIPPQNATNLVKSFPESQISPSIKNLIIRAMDPNPELRYQTAQEMLYAIDHLADDDPRTKRIRNEMRICNSITIFSGFAGASICLLNPKNEFDSFNIKLLIEHLLNAMPYALGVFLALIFFMAVIFAVYSFINRVRQSQRMQPIPITDYSHLSGQTDISGFEEYGSEATAILVDYDSRIHILQLSDLEHPERHFEVPFGESISIGRSQNNRIVLDYDRSVSGRHCEIYHDGTSYYVRDLNSSNGTFYEGVRVTDSCEINNGCTLRLGRLNFRVTIS